MHIGLIAPPWLTVPPLGYGGTERIIDWLARGFAARGHEVTLAASGDSTCPVQTVSTYDEALGFPTGATPFEARHILDSYAALGQCDVVHDHTALGPLLSRPEKYPPVVWTNHGRFDDPELACIFAAGCGGASVVAISRSQAAEAGPVAVDCVIHHGLDIDRVPMGDGRGGYLLSLARMTPVKGVATAIDVARAAGATLLIAAKMTEPAEEAYFEAEIRPKLSSDIRYVGEVDQGGALELLRGARALLNPIAWDEPFGLVMIEALASGTPVVGTPRGAAREIIDDGVTGFLRRTQVELVDAVCRVDELSRAACRAQAEQRFSADRMVDEHLRLYRRLVAGASRPALRAAREPEELSIAG